MRNFYCLIGALTSKTYTFMGRAQELERIESIDQQNIFGSPLYIEVSNLIIIRVLPRLTKFKYSEQITDQIRFSYDILLFQRITNIQELIKNKYVKSNYKQLYFYILNLQKFNFHYLKAKKVRLNLIIISILNEDCDFFFIKKLFNLSIFNIILNFKNFLFFKNYNISEFFLSEIEFENSFKTQIIQLIGVNLRMEQPLLMNVLYYKKKIKDFKIYSIYTSQSSIFNYKSYAFSLSELYLFFFFKNKYLTKKKKYDLKIFLKDLKYNNDLKYNFTYYVNYKLTNLVFNNFNLNSLIRNFFIVVRTYFKIFCKILVDNLYYYNYLVTFSDILKIERNRNFLFNKHFNNDFEINLYYESYIFILLNINSSFYFQLRKIDLNFFIGHHFLFINKVFYKFFVPITFFFEMDTLQYNFFGGLILGKFIYSPTLKVYENLDIIDYLFNLKIRQQNFFECFYYLFLNNIKFNLFNFFFKLYLKTFKVSLSFFKFFEIINNFDFYIKILLQFDKNNKIDFLNNLEVIKNSSFYQSQNLSFYKFNNYNCYLYIF